VSIRNATTNSHTTKVPDARTNGVAKQKLSVVASGYSCVVLPAGGRRDASATRLWQPSRRSFFEAAGLCRRFLLVACRRRHTFAWTLLAAATRSTKLAQAVGEKPGSGTMSRQATAHIQSVPVAEARDVYAESSMAMLTGANATICAPAYRHVRPADVRDDDVHRRNSDLLVNS
jgi:hypothetical protein